MGKATNYSPEELLKMVEHVAYEIGRFRWADQTLVQLRGENMSEGQWHDAVLESWAVHLRILADFFYAAPRQDDVTAGHFIKGWQAPAKSRLLAETERKADKQLAHLTLARAGEYGAGRKGWQCGQVAAEIEECVSLFLKGLTPALKSEFAKWGCLVETEYLTVEMTG